MAYCVFPLIFASLPGTKLPLNTLLPSAYAVEVMFSVYMRVCVFVCLSACSHKTFEAVNIETSFLVHLDHICFKFKYQGHWVNVKDICLFDNLDISLAWLYMSRSR